MKRLCDIKRHYEETKEYKDMVAIYTECPRDICREALALPVTEAEQAKINREIRKRARGYFIQHFWGNTQIYFIGLVAIMLWFGLGMAGIPLIDSGSIDNLHPFIALPLKLFFLFGGFMCGTLLALIGPFLHLIGLAYIAVYIFIYFRYDREELINAIKDPYTRAWKIEHHNKNRAAAVP